SYVKSGFHLTTVAPSRRLAGAASNGVSMSGDCANALVDIARRPTSTRALLVIENLHRMLCHFCDLSFDPETPSSLFKKILLAFAPLRLCVSASIVPYLVCPCVLKRNIVVGQLDGAARLALIHRIIGHDGAAAAHANLGARPASAAAPAEQHDTV